MIDVVWRDLGCREYLPVWQEMREFTDVRNDDSNDELWLVEHPPVFTQGQAGKAEHFLKPSKIPVIHTDRGGQITYHGPGQIVIYTLCNLKRIGLGVRGFVNAIENAIIELLSDYNIAAQHRAEAPGVYIGGSKIAALGLRVRRGCTYHGLSLNVDMDLSPYTYINPCGYVGMEVTQTRDHGIDVSKDELAKLLLQKLVYKLYAQTLLW